MKRILILMIFGTMLASCKQDVTCSSQETKLLLSKTYINEVVKHEDNKDIAKWSESHMDITFSDIQTISSNKDNGAQYCKAKIIFNIKSPVQKSIYDDIKNGRLKLEDVGDNVGNNNEIRFMHSLLYNGVIKDILEVTNDGFITDINYDTRVTDDTNKQLVNINDLERISSIAYLLNNLNFVSKPEEVILKGHISSIATAYIPIATFTSSGVDYSLGSNETSSSEMTDIIGKAGCSEGFDGVETPDCIIKVQLNKDKDTIEKIISAKKI